MTRDPLQFCSEEVDRLDHASLLRRIRSLDSGQEPEIVVAGRRLLLLASNNYLGLATDPRVTTAASEAVRRWGAGAGSARLITGSMRLHDTLEARLAVLKSKQAALLFSSGYLANVGAIAALTDGEDVILSDQLNHASIVDGARQSRAHVQVYRHRDVGHLEHLLRAHRAARRKLVVTDTVFSMDGDLAPLPELVALCEREGAILMVDEAHATGVVGPGGRGAVALFGLEDRVPVVMGTLSKALGAAGGYIAGSQQLISFLTNRARTFIFDTAISPPVAAAALAALRILESEPERPARARALAQRLAAGLRARDFNVPEPVAAIVPVLIGEPDAALAQAAHLQEAGLLVPAIRPPSVPAGTARLRATTMATHSEAQIDAAIEAFASTRVPA